MDISIRRVSPTDVEDIARLANDPLIARMTATMPYPYTREDAQKWIDEMPDEPNEHVFAICRGDEFIGVVGLVHNPQHDRAELGYWLGSAYWNKGYATAAAALALEYAFKTLNIRRVYAHCYAINPGSRRVLEKNGLKPEGCLRQHAVRLGEVHDLLCFGLLREEYLERK